ncbi:MAG: hypothetical protein AB1796_02590 [Bacillota bacterium]
MFIYYLIGIFTIIMWFLLKWLCFFKFEPVSAILSAVAAIGALGAAIAAAVSAYYSNKSYEADLKPILSISCFKPLKKENNLFPILIFFRNTSKGVALLKAVDVVPDPDNIYRANVGIPLAIGSSNATEIRIWLKKENIPVEIKFAIYYWDSTKKCHVTAAHVKIKYPDNHSLKVIEEYITQIKHNMPREVLHWPPTSNKTYNIKNPMVFLK